jgi:hypothetical protein
MSKAQNPQKPSINVGRDNPYLGIHMYPRVGMILRPGLKRCTARTITTKCDLSRDEHLQNLDDNQRERREVIMHSRLDKL